MKKRVLNFESYSSTRLCEEINHFINRHPEFEIDNVSYAIHPEKAYGYTALVLYHTKGDENE